MAERRFIKIGELFLRLTETGLLSMDVPELPAVTVNNTGAAFEGAPVTFRITLSAATSSAVTVLYATSNGTATAGTDYTETSGAALIPAGSTTADVVVETTLRSGTQGSRAFTMTISAARLADLTSLEITKPTSTGTILDITDTTAPNPWEISVAAVAVATEGTPLTFRVTSEPTPDEDITFGYTTSNGTATAGTDYTTASGTGTITAGTASTDIAVTTALRAGYQPARTVVMTISSPTTASLTGVTIGTAAASGTIADTEAPTGQNGYFDALVADPAHWKSYHLRSQAQIDAQSKTSGGNLDVTYSPTTDTNPQAQNAAKIVLSCWPRTTETMLGAAIDATTLTLQLHTLAGVPSGNTAFNAKGAQIRIGSEVVITDANNPFDRTTGILTLQSRGAYGTTAIAHGAGTLVYRASNSLRNQIHVPLVTADGSTYRFIWDTYFTDSFLSNGIGNFKLNQFTSDRSIWLEPQTDFSGNRALEFIDGTHVAVALMRSYNQPGGMDDYTANPPPGSVGNTTHLKKRFLGPEVSDSNPLAVTGVTAPTFLIWPGRWTRHVVQIQQRANDYDLLNVWLMDEVQDAVQICTDVRISVRGKTTSTGEHTPPETINEFYWEFNTSTAFLPAERTTDFRDLVAYTKNFVALMDDGAAISTRLVKPVADS